MSDGIDLDLTELTKLSADLGEVPRKMGPLLNSAIQFTSKRIKDEAAESVGGASRRWKALPRTIDYDISTGGFAGSLGGAAAAVLSGGTANSISSEIGYNKGRGAGPLGTVREFGANGSAPGNDLVNALHNNEGDFQKGIERAAADAERKAGL